MYQYQTNRRTEVQLRKEYNQKLNKACIITAIATAIITVIVTLATVWVINKLNARDARMEAYAKAHGCTWQWDMSGRILPADEAYICK